MRAFRLSFFFTMGTAALLLGWQALWGGDCNGNGVEDGEEIAQNASPDCNQNGIPDECEAYPFDIGLRSYAGIPVGRWPVALAAGDLDGDGRPDLAIVDTQGLCVWVLLDGTSWDSASAKAYSAGNAPWGIDLADLDGDLDLDIVVTNIASDRVSVLRNDGQGGFGPPAGHSTGRGPRAVVAADFDGDGRPDLGTANMASGDVTVRIQTAGGAFGPPASYVAGSGCRSLIAGDLDGDGSVDLVSANFSSRDLAVLRNAGDGTFRLTQRIATAGNPNAIAMADLDGDARFDLVAAQPDVGQVAVFLNDGKASFSPGGIRFFEFAPHFVRADDFDRDGRPDLAVAGQTASAGALAILRGGGDGTFRSPMITMSTRRGPSALSVADFDGDGGLDVAITSLLDGILDVYWQGQVGIFSVTSTSYSIPAKEPHGMAMGDFDGDGDPDLAIVNGVNRNLILLLNAGDGTLVGGPTFTSPGLMIFLEPTDMDGDGNLDIVAGWDRLFYFRNDGDGAFSAPVQLPIESVFAMTLEDFDGDSDTDLVVAGAGGPVRLLLNDGESPLGEPKALGFPAGAASVETGDFDRDGHQDLAAAYEAGRSVSVLFNLGNGDWGPPARQALPLSPSFLTVGDFDGDSNLDLVATEGNSSQALVLFNRGDGSFRFGVAFPTGSHPFFVTAGDMDGDEDLDLATANADLGAMSFIWNTGKGVFAAPIQFDVGDRPRSILAGDLDGDGSAELLAANRNANTVTVLRSKPSPSPEFLESICTAAEYHWISLPSRQSTGARRVTKFLLPAKEDPALLSPLFQNVNRYALHQDFLLEVFPDRFPSLGAEEYLNLVARRGTRSYFVGNISLFSTDRGPVYGFSVFTDESRAEELLSLEETRSVHDRLQRCFHLEVLAYAPDTRAAVLAAEKWGDAGFPIHLEEGPAFTYQAYTVAANYGRVRILTRAEFLEANQEGRLSWQDILILEEAPSDIEGVVAGVITATPQGELSHLTVRTARRGTPNAYLKGALDVFNPLEGKLIRLEVKATEHLAAEAPLADAEKWWAEHRPRLSQLPGVDREYAALDSLEEIDASTPGSNPEARFGGKASNFARLQRILTGSYERYREKGFAIPMKHYLEFLRSNATTSPRDPLKTVTYEEYLAELLSWDRFQSDSQFRFAALQAFRDMVEDDGFVDPDLVAQLAARITEVFGSSKVPVRFRSSSNIEDSLEFNGAGLYESTGACAADDLDADERGPSRCDSSEQKERNIARALKLVWASLWTFRAYEERAWYQIPQDQIAMGILVSGAFLDERANGVAFTGNPANPLDRRYLVTAQKGEASVVQPEPGVTAEVDGLTMAEGKVTRIERISPSSLVPEGILVLSDTELQELGGLLWYIDGSFPLNLGSRSREEVLLDVEFKVDPAGAIAVKQARPFLTGPPAPPGPTFELEVPQGTMACGVFLTGRAPRLEYQLKSQVRFLSGKIVLPSAERSFQANIFEEVLVGPAYVPAVPAAPGSFIVDMIPGPNGAIYRFEYEQDFSVGGGVLFQLKLLALDYEVRDGEPIHSSRTLDAEYVTKHLFLEGGPLGEEGHFVRYSSCSYEALPLWLVEAEIEGGSRIQLQERCLPSLVSTGPAALVGARVSIGGTLQEITDYWSLVYTAYRHNRSARYWVILNSPTTLEGVAKPVHAIEIQAPDPPLGVSAGASYLDQGLNVLASPRVISFQRSEVAESPDVPFRRGDANSSGRVDITDAIHLLLHLFQGGAVPPCAKSADVDDNGSLNLTDAIGLLSHLFRGAGALPEPFQACGLDPSPDGLGCSSFPPCN